MVYSVGMTNADFLLDSATRQRLASRVENFADRRADHDLKQAAVAITVFADEGHASVIVTKRQPRLKDHGGQWALPGGRLDAGETAMVAALRELEEEVNLSLTEDSVLGLLDDYVTRSGYVITPVVVWSDSSSSELSPNPDEVASIHGFSFAELMRQDSPNLERIAESDREVLSMNYLDDVMYAPTAAMLYQFREVCLLDKPTRVLHYDQPLFAWR